MKRQVAPAPAGCLAPPMALAVDEFRFPAAAYALTLQAFSSFKQEMHR